MEREPPESCAPDGRCAEGALCCGSLASLLRAANLVAWCSAGGGSAVERIDDSDNVHICGRRVQEPSVGAVPPWQGAVHPDDRGRVAAVFSDKVYSVPTVEEYRVVDPDGRVRWVLDRTFPAHGTDEGCPAAVLGVSEDITARKRKEQAAERANRRLDELARAVALAEERERRRLARDLHDGPCQLMAVAAIKARLLRSHVEANPELAAELTELAALLDESHDSVRHMSFQLSPPALERQGLVAATRWLAEDLTRRHGIPFRVEDDGAPKPLDDTTRALLYRCVRELLFNALKHAHAESVTIRARTDGHQIVVTVCDDGRGFELPPGGPTAAPSGGSGYGLPCVAERMQRLGGEVAFTTQPGQGTTVTLRAPLPEPIGG